MATLRLTLTLAAALCATSAAADSVRVPTLSSDAWLRTGPSTAEARITGLPRGTAVIELEEDIMTAFKARSRRWMRVHVLEGRARGREGWIWGELVGCCEAYDWLD